MIQVLMQSSAHCQEHGIEWPELQDPKLCPPQASLPGPPSYSMNKDLLYSDRSRGKAQDWGQQGPWEGLWSLEALVGSGTTEGH